MGVRGFLRGLRGGVIAKYPLSFQENKFYDKMTNAPKVKDKPALQGNP
ncbi:hypothetical protein N206_03450 [Helicobacter pylori UM111]|nr:hypothetical protein N206_03450 [Helicobacter pylori UM111]